jgi:hypothetical protein
MLYCLFPTQFSVAVGVGQEEPNPYSIGELDYPQESPLTNSTIFPGTFISNVLIRYKSCQALGSTMNGRSNPFGYSYHSAQISQSPKQVASPTPSCFVVEILGRYRVCSISALCPGLPCQFHAPAVESGANVVVVAKH